MIAPVESTRSGDVITVQFENDVAVAIPCPAALIGNPIARLIADAERWRTRPTPPWRLLDCPPEHSADLQELLASMDPGASFGAEPGWYGLIAQAWRELRAQDAACTVTQVKQKVGSLRISVLDGAGRVNPALKAPCVAARDWSERTCEWCAGETDTAAGVGSPSRLCVACRAFADRWNAAWKAAGA